MPEFGHKFLDVRRPEPRVIPLKPKIWPQDRVAAPNGYGQLPPISKGNKYLGKEFFAFQTVFDNNGTNNFPANATFTNTLAMEAYGDFWMCNISLVAVDTTTDARLPYSFGFNGLGVPYVSVSAVDITTGYDILNETPAVSLITDNVALADIGRVYTRASRSTMPIPHVFTRDGGVSIVLKTKAFPATNCKFYVMLEGWREYQNASR